MDATPNGVDVDGTHGAQVPALLHAAFDALPDPAIVVEVGTGRILLANRAAESAPGLVPREGVDDATASAGHDRDDGQDARTRGCAIRDAEGRRVGPGDTPVARAARGESFSGMRVDCHAAGPAGHRTTYHVSAVRLPACSDAVVVRFADVTDIGAAEAALRDSVQARDEFVSIATHELKEPLTSILLSLQLLQMQAGAGPTVPSDEVRNCIGVIRRQGDRLARLIENLLDVSRINNTRLQLDREALDLCELVHDCVEQFGEDARRAGSELTMHACVPCIGYFDRLRVEQVLANLVSNAIKYGAGKPIRVRLDAGAETAVLQVADQGIGIAPADQHRVFERFERATRGHLRRSLGLGLYIVRAIVEAHGGTIRLHSEVGVGSTFTVELPRHRLADRGGEQGDDVSGAHRTQATS